MGEDEGVTRTKVVFIAFAKEDEGIRNLFSGQRLHVRSPFSFVDMGVGTPYSSEWRSKVLTRVRRSDGVIALISSHTPRATGQLWEIKCAIAEKKPLLGIWIENRYRTKPPEMGAAACEVWKWANVSQFIDSLP